MYSRPRDPDFDVMDEAGSERLEALAWLLEDPANRCIVSPSHVAALFLFFAATAQYPAADLTEDQFLPANRYGGLGDVTRQIRTISA